MFCTSVCDDMLLSSELGEASATAVEEVDGCNLASHQEAMVRFYSVSSHWL